MRHTWLFNPTSGFNTFRSVFAHVSFIGQACVLFLSKFHVMSSTCRCGFQFSPTRGSAACQFPLSILCPVFGSSPQPAPAARTLRNARTGTLELDLWHWNSGTGMLKPWNAATLELQLWNWTSGTWHSGTWQLGTWHSGSWHSGTWPSRTRPSRTWTSGTFDLWNSTLELCISGFLVHLNSGTLWNFNSGPLELQLWNWNLGPSDWDLRTFGPSELRTSGLPDL